MIKALSSEFRKTKHRKIWLIIAALLLTQIAWSLWSFSKLDAHDLEQGWESGLFNFLLLNSIIMPVVMAVIASRLCDVEHKGQTLKLIETLIPAGKFFDAKFLFGSIYLIAVSLLQVVYLIVVGKIFGFEGNPPMGMFGYYLLFNTSISVTILLFQQILSLLFPNQMVSLSVGLMGGLVGVMLLYLPPIFSNFLIWGYYGVLNFVNMDWNPTTRIVNYSFIPVNWTGFIILVCIFCAMYIIGRRLFIRKEI